MKLVAARFATNMDNILGLLDIVASAIHLGKEDPGRRRVSSSFQMAAREVHGKVVASAQFTLVAFDGAFLTACAEYELVIRDLIQAYISRAVMKCPQFNHLPKAMRDWYPRGCARIILNIDFEKFQHLTQDGVVQSLAGCAKNRSGKMLGEAYYDNDRNFSPEDLEDCFNRVAIEKIWQKIARDSAFQVSVGTNRPETAEQIGRAKLRATLMKRNNIVHRGRPYYTPSESEVRDDVSFLRAFVVTLAAVMETSLAAL